MSSINFCTPVSYGNHPKSLSQSFLEFADDYFFFGGDKAVVHFGYVEGESLGVELVHVDSSWVSTALKVISYFTIILPVVLLIAKCILRSIHRFHLLPPLSNNDLVLKRHESTVINELLANTNLPKVLAEIVAGYITSEEDYCFGTQEWMRYFGVDVMDPERELNPYEFYRFWFRRDPIDPTKQVCETHFPPVLRPRTHDATSYRYSLKTLGLFIQHPREGHPSRYYDDNTFALRENGGIQAGPVCWIVMRKDVLARNQSYLEQIQAIKDLNIRTGAGYEEESSAIDLATVVSAHYVVNGERYLGDNTGVENCWTFGRVKETITIDENTYQMVIGGFSSPLAVEGGAPGGLGVDSRCAQRYSAVVPLRKF